MNYTKAVKAVQFSCALISVALLWATAGCAGPKQESDFTLPGRTANSYSQARARELLKSSVDKIVFTLWNKDQSDTQDLAVTNPAEIQTILKAFSKSTRAESAWSDPGEDFAAEPLDSVSFQSAGKRLASFELDSYELDSSRIDDAWGKEVAEIYRKYRMQASAKS